LSFVSLSLCVSPSLPLSLYLYLFLSLSLSLPPLSLPSVTCSWGSLSFRTSALHS
jgi:hypothetical protein